jgi:hypothetical protein
VPSNKYKARAALAEHFDRLILDPTLQAGEASYSVRGEVDFLGSEALTRTDGPAWTERLPIHFGWLAVA